MALLWVFGVFLMFLFRASALTDPLILISPPEVNNVTSAVLTCNLTNPLSAVKGHYWAKNGKVIEATKVDTSETYTSTACRRLTATLEESTAVSFSALQRSATRFW
ncbi:hypothetical protein ANANG_G00092600 [Anguilla anguilla]|uniref:Ig-like domain-containing protein n=1 Tax=Anguilla anguilla TaxID=7936 RepID=A0A9D3MP40_ANGAN|nr:hypothetical protein ANANG_G00092600 [Anguilla anguilla]